MLWTRQLTTYSLMLLASLTSASITTAQQSGYQPVVTAAPVNENGGCGSATSNCGQQGAYFNQSSCCDNNECGQCDSCSGGIRNAGLFGIVKGLLPFGDSGCLQTYRSVFGGWADLDDYNGNNGGGQVSGTFNDGFVLGTAKGVYICPNTAIELEGTWRNNTGENWDNGFAVTPLDGQFNNFSTMLNVKRELGGCHRFTPYAGLGTGFSRQDAEFVVAGNDLEIEDWAFAYQGIAGLKFKQSDCASLFVEYRYFGNTKTQLTTSNGGGPVNDIGDYEYTSENIIFGIQFKR